MRNQNYGGTLAGLGPQRSPTAENNEPSSPIMALMTGLQNSITTKGSPALRENGHRRRHITTTTIINNQLMLTTTMHRQPLLDVFSQHQLTDGEPCQPTALWSSRARYNKFFLEICYVSTYSIFTFVWCGGQFTDKFSMVVPFQSLSI